MTASAPRILVIGAGLGGLCLCPEAELPAAGDYVMWGLTGFLASALTKLRRGA
jgi:hypothetical protein